MVYYYDICGTRIRLTSPETVREPFSPIFKRDALSGVDMDVELVPGVDHISTGGIAWDKDSGFCLAHVREDGSSVYEYSYPTEDRLVCRMEAAADYSRAVIAFKEGLDASAGQWLTMMIQLLHRCHMIISGGLVMHAVSIQDGGRAILFSGPSGMGKSTQANLWAELRGSEIINGDRTTLVFRSGVLYATGSAWSGNSRIFTELSAPVKAIVFLEQAKEDTARRLTHAEALQNMIPRSYLPYFNQGLMDKALGNIELVMGCTPFFLLRNTATLESVRVLEEALATPS